MKAKYFAFWINLILLISLLASGISSVIAESGSQGNIESQQIEWSEEKWIADGCFGDIVYEDNYLHVGAGVNGANYFHSSDDGETWSEPKTPLGYTFCIEAEGDNVYCAYNMVKGVVNFIIHNCELFFIKSENCGQTWSDEVQLSLNPDTDVAPSLGVNGNTVHLIWGHEGQLCYTKSITQGWIWRSPKELYPDGATSDMAVSDDRVHIICSNWGNDLIYIRSLDNGDSWEYYLIAHNSYHPRIAVDQEDVYITWRDKEECNIYCLKSPDSGDTWRNPIKLTTSGLACSPEIVAEDNVAILAYSDKKFGNYEVCLRVSMDRGMTWSEEVRVTDHPEYSFMESMDLNEDTLHLIWFDGRDEGSIYYKRGVITTQENDPLSESSTTHKVEEGQDIVENIVSLRIYGNFSYWFSLSILAVIAVIVVKARSFWNDRTE